jgi:hypothetical protein
MARALMYKKELFVWLDETGYDNRNYMRRYGYSIKGQVPVCTRLLVRGQRISAIAAITSDGLLSLELSTGPTNSDIFYDFVRGSLIHRCLHSMALVPSQLLSWITVQFTMSLK